MPESSPRPGGGAGADRGGPCGREAAEGSAHGSGRQSQALTFLGRGCLGKNAKSARQAAFWGTQVSRQPVRPAQKTAFESQVWDPRNTWDRAPKKATLPSSFFLSPPVGTRAPEPR